MRAQRDTLLKFVAVIACVLLPTLAMVGQGRGGGRGGGQGAGRGAAQPAIVSPEITADHHITFRIVANQAQAVRLSATDIPNLGPTATLTKGEVGVWSTTVGPVDPGAY